MHDHGTEIDHDPLAHRVTIDRERLDLMLFFQPVANLGSDRFQVRFGRSRADQKIFRESGNLAQIERENFFRLFVAGEFRAETN
jgi:hypothetical protein